MRHCHPFRLHPLPSARLPSPHSRPVHAQPMPLAQIEVEVAGTRAEVGAWLGHEGEGALHPAGVARTFPDPFPPAAVTPPCTFSFPDQQWCAAPPLGCVRTRAPSPSAPGFARCSTHPSWGCAASPPRSPLGERWGFVGADGGTWLHTRGSCALSRHTSEVGEPVEEAHVQGGALSLLSRLAQSGGVGHADTLPLPSHSLCKGMGAEWCACPLHGRPSVHHPCRKEGV